MIGVAVLVGDDSGVFERTVGGFCERDADAVDDAFDDSGAFALVVAGDGANRADGITGDRSVVAHE